MDIIYLLIMNVILAQRDVNIVLVINTAILVILDIIYPLMINAHLVHKAV